MKFFSPCIAVALLFVACDDHISVAPRDGDSLLPVCEGCDNSSSSDIAPVSNSSETALLGSSAGPAESPVDEPAESSESAKSSSSAKSSESAKISSSSSEKEAVSSSIGTEDIILPNDYNSEMLVKAVPCRTDSTDSCEYGTLTDERDGQTYKTAKIGNLWWMAENLNYAYLQPVADMDSGSFCLNDSLENCEKYGRLYPWAIALGICPSGWHLPWYEEYKTLLGGRSYASGWGLKSTEWNGTDDFGFAALPSGVRFSNGSSTSGYTGFVGGGLSEVAIFWTDTKAAYHDFGEFELAINFRVYSSDGATLSEGNMNDSYAVRCVKDY